MPKNNEPIYWLPELTDEAENMSDEFLAELFAPIIREMMKEDAVITHAF